LRTGKTRDILVISPTFPYPLISGGKLRIFHILEQLSREYGVTLITLAENGDDTSGNRSALRFLEELITVPIDQSRNGKIKRILMNAHRYLLGEPAVNIVKSSTGMHRQIRKTLAERRFDAVQIEYSQFMSYLPLVQSFGIPCLAVAHDVSHISLARSGLTQYGLRRLFWDREARLMKAFETAMWARPDRVVAMSDTDADYIRSLIPEATVDVVPNGVDVTNMAVREKHETPTITFVGWMRHHPNLDAITWFLQDIWLLVRALHPSVRFHIIGRGLPGHLAELVQKDERTEYLGFVEDIQSAVGKSWLSVVPLRIGSGTRLKILESMGLGTPVVSTTIGAEGIKATDGEHILIADTPGEFARRVVELLDSEVTRQGLASSGRRLVEDLYAWEKIGLLSCRAIEASIEQHRKGNL